MLRAFLAIALLVAQTWRSQHSLWQVFDNLVASLLHLQPVVSIEEIAATTLLPSESFAQAEALVREELAAIERDAEANARAAEEEALSGENPTGN